MIRRYGQRAIGWIVSAGVLLSLVPTPSVAAIDAPDETITPPPESSVVVVDDDTSTPPDPLPPVDDYPVKGSSAVMVTALQTTGGPAFIELYNSSSNVYDTARLKLDVYSGDGLLRCMITPSGYMLPSAYALMEQSVLPPADPQIHTYDCGADIVPIARIAVYEDGQARPIEDIRPPLDDTQLWVRKGTTASSRSGVFLTDFRLLDRAIYQGGWYIPPADMALQVREVLVHPRDCLPDDTGLDCYDYVKITNPSDHEIDLANYRLRSGFVNAKSTSSNTFYLSGVVQPGETSVIMQTRDGAHLSIAANDGTVWFEDEFGVTSYATNVMAYVGSSAAANQGRSWAYDDLDQTWKWATPAPDQAANDFSAVAAPALLPCPAGQYRSTETNRCRVVASVTTYTPCRDGQYRSEITHRCRTIALAGGTLTPCKDDQYRSEETNRCRNIATAASTLTPCKEGQERNPETNRCRNVTATSIPDAAFAITPVKQAGKAFVGWWALGGVGVLALAYAGWEWHREILGGLRRVGQFFTSRR